MVAFFYKSFSKSLWVLMFGVLFFATLSAPFVIAESVNVDATDTSLAIKVAPGETLPVSIKLSNFGGVGRVDVVIAYGIFNEKGEEIQAINETIAVETTTNFTKIIQISPNTPSGSYVAKATITYQGQLTPAISQFDFTVENKIFGFFLSDFYWYASLIVLLVVTIMVLVYFLAKHFRATRTTPFDYSDIPHDQRVFFELLSDTIMQMRSRVGDAALEVASHINGLEIDKKTGRVLKLTDSPSKIIALLVLGYEKALGQKVSFSFRKN